MQRRRAVGRRMWMVIWIAIPATFFVLGLLDWQPPPLCMWSRFFHIRCPGCGLTHAALDLCRLDFSGAWRHNPLSWVVVPLVGFLYLRWGWRMWHRN